jgi:DNA repair protein RecO (recombination protein O)
MALSGFEPLMGRCSACGVEDLECAFLEIYGGTLRCGGCGSAGGRPLGRGALNAARYILGADAKKLFSFTLSGDSLRELAVASEAYLLAHLDRSFRTLDYYNAVKSPANPMG